MEFSFETMEFRDKGDKIEIVLLMQYKAEISKAGLGDVRIEEGKISIEDGKVKKFNNALLQSFDNLTNMLNGKQTVYVHKNSGIPLIGHVAFGIVDRGTNIIEVKPNTGCNLKCIYCSVNEDLRPVDFVIEKDYLVEELEKLFEYKKCDKIELNIGTQGEPLLYADLIPFIKDMAENKYVKAISINTNGTLLTEKRVDDLFKSGLTRINLSLNAMSPGVAKRLANAPYKVEQIQEIAKYISKKGELLLAPVWVPGINDEMDKIIEFAKNLDPVPKLGIQNFLNYKFGRNPVKQKNWEEFYEDLKEFEKKYDVKLTFDKMDFDVVKTRELEKPFKKGEIVTVQTKCPGRLKGEKIAVAGERVITIPKCNKNGNVKVKITRNKHNIFVGEQI